MPDRFMPMAGPMTAVHCITCLRELLPPEGGGAGADGSFPTSRGWVDVKEHRTLCAGVELLPGETVRDDDLHDPSLIPADAWHEMAAEALESDGMVRVSLHDVIRVLQLVPADLREQAWYRVDETLAEHARRAGS
jgi:hypothetical protein